MCYSSSIETYGKYVKYVKCGNIMCKYKMFPEINTKCFLK